ncbi:outer membrane lipoprotein carrier protein LolA [Natrarchaeobius sp. A-rgal3]|uniref:LolA family protein n=1 Tax=Natrarchaeobius versutus TaxID=1679078 RepID=UPI00350F6BF8
MRRRRLLVATAGIGLAGCVAVPGVNDDPSGEELLQDAIETRTDLVDLAARRTLSAETPDGTSTRVERVRRRPPGERRMEVVDSENPATPPGTTTVRSRAVTWTYDPAVDEVRERHHPNRVVADGTRLALEALLAEYDLAYEGVEPVDGRDAHRIEATPTSADVGRSIELLVGETVYAIPLEATEALEEATVSRTIWIDDEHRYPIKERDAVRDATGTLVHRLTVTYENLAINAGLEPETFTFTPPADAELVTTGLEPAGIFDSRSVAGEVTPYDLPNPDVPDPYDLDRITVVDEGDDTGTTATFWYVATEGRPRELYVACRDHQRFDPDVLKEIEFDGRTAYRRDGRIESVFWACNGTNYEVSSPVGDVSVLEIASSMGCPQTSVRP